MNEAPIGGIDQERFNCVRPSFVTQKRDQRACVKHNIHRARSSLAISRSLRAANAALLVRTCAYLPFIARALATRDAFAFGLFKAMGV